MASEWLDQVRIYAPDADPGTVEGIVRYCGIGLRTAGAARIDFADPVETVRVRDHYCRNKLGVTADDTTIDSAIQAVRQRMGDPTSADRVPVYYLLAQHFGKLGLFAGSAAAAAAGGAPRRVEARPVAARSVPGRRRDKSVATAAIGCGALAAIVVATAAAAIFLGHPLDPGPGVPASVAVANGPPPVYAIPPAVNAAPAAAAPAAPVVPQPGTAEANAAAIPTGAGVTGATVGGKPQLSVYFATAKSDLAPDFAQAAGPVKAYLDAHAGARLQVSGFNDPRGDAAFNAELSKHRAQAVAAALAKLGVPAGSIDLVKPADTTDAAASQAGARRVDVTVIDAK